MNLSKNKISSGLSSTYRISKECEESADLAIKNKDVVGILLLVAYGKHQKRKDHVKKNIYQENKIHLNNIQIIHLHQRNAYKLAR
jgi:hypothetical protein